MTPSKILERMSPADAFRDPRFEYIIDDDGDTYPTTCLRVVRHRDTNTLWGCRFRVRDDDSDVDDIGRWFEVEARTETRTILHLQKGGA